MRKSFSGKLLLGIGECWRYGASEDEIALNALMTDRSFAALLSTEDIPERIGETLNDEPTKEEIDGRAELEAANNTSAPNSMNGETESYGDEEPDESDVDLLAEGREEYQEEGPDPFNDNFNNEDYEPSDEQLGDTDNE